MPIFPKKICFAKNGRYFEFSKHRNAYISKTGPDRADYTDYGCHNHIRLEAEHFLNTLALTFISFSGRLSFFCKRSSSVMTERSINLLYIAKKTVGWNASVMK